MELYFSFFCSRKKRILAFIRCRVIGSEIIVVYTSYRIGCALTKIKKISSYYWEISMPVAYCLYYMVFTAISTVIRDENTTRLVAKVK